MTFIRLINMKSITNEHDDGNKFVIDGNLIGDNSTLYTNEIQSQMASINNNNDDQLQLQFRATETNPFGDVRIKSDGLNPNSLHLSAITGNLEFKINNRLVIKSEKPRRSLQIENDCLIIEDSSTSMAYIQQQPGGLRLSQIMTDSIVGCSVCVRMGNYLRLKNPYHVKLITMFVVVTTNESN
ncbi:hypothetical protein BLA29_001958 [Euroglyphus maynei]|uniref:Uncharacterized protein n=1 Tax=Euroglyphus maynei TaxID=6958 RepID=A0A1Y3BGU0_EURMA|nr:hypothetical protein BLA29_001958 [Euroglyphus maynei]